MNKTATQNGKIPRNASNSISLIMNAVIGCIASHGYEGASMQDIAMSANVSKSLLHYHFKSKEDLVISALTMLTTDIVKEIREAVLDQVPSLQSLMQSADLLYERLISKKERVEFFVEMYATAIHNARLREKMEDYHRLQAKLIREILEGTIGGLFIEDNVLDLTKLTEMVQTAIEGLSIDSVFLRDEEKIRARFSSIINLIITMIIRK